MPINFLSGLTKFKFVTYQGNCLSKKLIPRAVFSFEIEQFQTLQIFLIHPVYFTL